MGAVTIRWRRVVPRGVALAIVGAVLIVAAAPAGAAASWSVVGPVTGAQYGHLAAVSCTSPVSCFAVGVIDTPTRETKLVERWNGTKWSVVASANPTGAVNSQLTSVHCRSSTSCVAVGQYDTASVTKTLVERWNGSKWSIVSSPNPASVAVSGLASVRCPSTTFCVAVGSYYISTPDSSDERTLVEHWNGSTWSIVASPNRSTAIDNGLSGLSCPSAASCFAVGHSRTNLATKTLVEVWNGASWSIASSPNAASSPQSELTGVTCRSTTSCVAVGSGHGTLIERWNGSKWTIVTSPNPSSYNSAALTAVACPSAIRCYAVGDFFSGSNARRLAETWNGSKWSIVATPLPSGTIRSGLSGVSCATTSNCFAVGDYRLGPSRRPLINHLS